MKRKTTTSRYDVAEHLRSPEEMAAYLEACLEEAEGARRHRPSNGHEPGRARGGALAREPVAPSGERSPDFDTILRVVGALGLRLHAEAARG